MAVYEETINLGGNMSQAAKDSAAQFKILEEAVKSTQTALVKAQAKGDVMQVKKLTKDIDAYKATLSTLPSPMKEVAATTDQAAASQNGMASSSAGLQEELAEMTGGLSAVIEAVGAVVVGFGALVVAGAALAIEASEARQKMVSLFDSLGEGKISGQETIAMIDQLGDSIGMTRDKLAPLAQGFLTLGVTGKEELEGLTKAAASAGAIAEGGAESFTKLFGQVNAAAETGSKLTIPFKKLEAQLKSTGLNIGDLAKQMGISQEALTKGLKAGTIDAAKFGDALTDAATDKGAGALAQQGMSLTNIWAKFKENIMKMFESIDVGPFLAQVKDLFDIFGQGKASGQALTTGIGGFFKQVFALATKVVPYIKHFLLDLVILGLKGYIGLKPIIAWVKDLAANQSVMNVFWTALRGIGLAIGAVAVVIGVVVGAAALLMGALLALQIAIVGAGGYLMSLVADAGKIFTDWIGSAASMAMDFVKGLVSGISSGAGMVVDAVKGLADGAKNAFKSALGIHSPSKVMMEMGGNIAAGAAGGIDDGAPDVHAASKDLAGAAAGGFASGGDKAGGAPAGGSGGVTVTVEAGAIVIQGGSSASVSDLTEQAISLLFERVALSQGL